MGRKGKGSFSRSLPFLIEQVYLSQGCGVTGMIEWSQKSRPKKTLGLPAKLKKIPWPKFNPPKIPCPGLLNNSKTPLFVLYLQNYAARALPILSNTPKKSLLRASYPKKYMYMPNFPTQKNPRIENFKPKKFLWSPRHLKSRVSPLGYLSNNRTGGRMTWHPSKLVLLPIWFCFFTVCEFQSSMYYWRIYSGPWSQDTNNIHEKYHLHKTHGSGGKMCLFSSSN